MERILLKSKIHRATITEADLHYEGSISIDSELLKAANITEYEKVLVANVNNGERFETYAVLGKPGEICLNGAAAHLGKPGDLVIIMAWVIISDAESHRFKPKVVFVDENNRQKGV